MNNDLEDADDRHHRHFRFHPPHVRLPHIHWPHFHIHFHDRPLAGAPHPDRPLHWRLYFCEAIATAVLMIVGLSCVILLSAPDTWLGQAMAELPHLQSALCGLCFGLAGTLAAMTPFGRVSGAHLNPSVTLAFMLSRKIVWVDALGYAVAQIVGAFGGTFFVYGLGRLFAPWRLLARDAHYGATLPYTGLSVFYALASEACVTALLVGMLYWLAAHPRFRRVTPWIGGLFFFLMNPLTAWLSGNSVNFARSLAPALFAGAWPGLWIYLVGPFIGSSLAVLIIQSNLLGKIHLLEARLINFGHHGRVPHLDDPDFRHAAPDHYHAYRSHLDDIMAQRGQAANPIAGAAAPAKD
ncbi:porin [Neoasaia chiangmaiensis]|uniref:Porin n=1 Tax=Neoasaia chiangmaiensis TaxID=320497 RepID=A0A1U9KNV0_9PROT|nr:aquaporin [Neoasaia chiangmaiensis]AQS87477.1 porin [Neoasaia chiangmaiensis]